MPFGYVLNCLLQAFVYVPQSQRVVFAGCYEVLAVWAEANVPYGVGVASENRDELARRRPESERAIAAH